MKTAALLPIVFVVSALGGCASTELSATTVLSTPPGGRARIAGAGLAPSSPALALLADAFGCMADQTPAARCATIAQAARVSPEALRQASALAVEQVSEVAARSARQELVPSVVRSSMMRWFDLAAGAARETRAVVAAAEGSSTDASWARAHAQLSALFAYAPTAAELAPETEACGLLLLATRVRAAERARAEVRDELTASLAEVLREADAAPVAAPAARASGDLAGARQSDGATSLAATQSAVSSRLATVATRLTSPALRTASERVAEATQLRRR